MTRILCFHWDSSQYDRVGKSLNSRDRDQSKIRRSADIALIYIVSNSDRLKSSTCSGAHLTRYPAIITLDETKAISIHFIEEFHSHDVVLKRLKRMKEDHKEREKAKDPFKKTILERIREALGSAFETRNHQIRAKLHWFATSDWRRVEIEQEMIKQHNLSSMSRIIQDNRGINYHTESLDVGSIAYDSGNSNYSDEYLSLLRENAELKKQVTAEQPKPILYSPGALDSIQSPSAQKITSEQFLSVSRFAPGKREATSFAAEVDDSVPADSEAAESFFQTKAWTEESETPTEKWDPQINFSPVPVSKHANMDKVGEGLMDEAAKMLGALLHPAEGGLAVDGI